MPVNIKWEFRIDKNVNANLNFGINYNWETDSNYVYSNSYDYEKYNSKQYFSNNFGFGLNYFLSKNQAIFLNIEKYIGGTRGNTGGLVFSTPIYNTNTLINFGYKHNFKK